MRIFLKLVSFIPLLIVSNVVWGQLMIRGFDYRPTGNFGSVMNPAVSAEIGWQHAFDDDDDYPIRFGFSFTFIQFQPRMATFPTYAVMMSGSTGTTVLPGAESYQKYNYLLGFFDFDYAFIHRKKFYVFIGMGVIMGGANVNYTSYVQGIGTSVDNGGDLGGGVRFRLGAEYILNDYIAIIANANRSVILITDPETFNWSNDYGIGLRYTFNLR